MTQPVDTSQPLCCASVLTTKKNSHGGRDEAYSWAQPNGLPLTKTVLATVVTKFPTCQAIETNSMSLIWHHPLVETNQRLSGKLTSLNSFYPRRGNNSSRHLDSNQQMLQLWVCLSYLPGPRQHHFPRAYREFDLLTGDPTEDHTGIRDTLYRKWGSEYIPMGSTGSFPCCTDRAMEWLMEVDFVQVSAHQYYYNTTCWKCLGAFTRALVSFSQKSSPF